MYTHTYDICIHMYRCTYTDTKCTSLSFICTRRWNTDAMGKTMDMWIQSGQTASDALIRVAGCPSQQTWPSILASLLARLVEFQVSQNKNPSPPRPPYPNK